MITKNSLSFFSMVKIGNIFLFSNGRYRLSLLMFFEDIVTRYAHGRGFHVERRFGWDTHGLPVEYEIDKKLGIKVKKKE